MHRSRLQPLRGFAAALVILAWALAPSPAAAQSTDKHSATNQRPNVIVIISDDQGWMDSAVYGSEYYDTPNIDRLASQGLRFTNAYSANPLCSPTRLSILTGDYPHRYGMTAPVGHLPPLPPDTPDFRPGAPWQAYQTFVSKRYIPDDVSTFGDAFHAAGYATAFMGKWHLGKLPHSPEKHGFDRVVGGRGNPGPPGGYFAPWRSDTLPKRPKGTHIDDTITDTALDFIEQNHSQNKPFLLDLNFYDVHAPFQGKEKLTEKYRHKTDPRGKQDLPVMGAMIQTLDTNLGRVMDKLDELGIAENTIIVFWSDNGGNMYDHVDGTTPTNNAPLAFGKGNIHEGGIRVPAIVRWPGVTKAGAVSDAIVSTIDIYPTLLAMTGVAKPDDAKFDGISIAPVLRGEKLDRDTMFFHFPHYVPKPKNISASAVRRGDYKLIRVYDKPDTGDAPYRYELYNLSEDIGEENNIAEEHPDMVRELDALIAQHLKDTGTPVPPPNPRYDPKAYNPLTGEGVKPEQPKPVAGWNPSPSTFLELEDGNLAVDSRGDDPWMMTADVPSVSAPVQLRVRMNSNGNGTGQAYWASDKKPSFVKQFVEFPMQHDSQWHEYDIDLPVVGQLIRLRLDPGRGKGKVRIDWIKLVHPGPEAGGQDQTLKAWDFEK